MSADPKERLLLAAEELFSRKGIEAVSLREIGIAAGNLNKSAVHYHFGSKDQLLQAIVEYRLPALQSRRQELIDTGLSDDLRSWLECHIRAIMEQADLPDSHYLGFISELHIRGSRRDRFGALPKNLGAEVNSFHARLLKLMTHLEEPIRSHRAARAQLFMIHAAADRERLQGAERSLFPLEIEITDLIDGMAGFLDAPASSGAKALMGSGPAAAATFLF